MKNGLLAEEITPVTINARKGSVTVTDDEGVRPDTTAGKLAALPPAFAENGSITAGSASQLSDGACAVVVTSAERAAELGLTPLAEIGGYGTVAGPGTSLLLQPANAIRDALRRDGAAGLDDLDLIEINEAFAAVTLASARDLGVSATGPGCPSPPRLSGWVIGAGFNGTSFLNYGHDFSSLIMAGLWALALACYLTGAILGMRGR